MGLRSIITLGALAAVLGAATCVSVTQISELEKSSPSEDETAAEQQPDVALSTDELIIDRTAGDSIEEPPPSSDISSDRDANDRTSELASAATDESLDAATPPQTVPARWRQEFSKTNFDKTSIDFDSVLSGGPPKDGIPAIDTPTFGPIEDAKLIYSETEPVVTVNLNGEAKAYPLAILMWHEIVNDDVGGIPVAVTFCPLCNSTIVFSREVNGTVLDFGTTGRLMSSNLLMYDRQTESWWQQYIGLAVIGDYTGIELDLVPARVEAISIFEERFPDGKVMEIPSGFNRNYGINPYANYDQAGVPAEQQRPPFLYSGDLRNDIAPLAYVIVVGNRAWSLNLLRNEQRIETDDGLIITWRPGRNSALDDAVIANGQDIGNVTVQRIDGDRMLDVAHDVSFAFAFHAFYPQGDIFQ